MRNVDEQAVAEWQASTELFPCDRGWCVKLVPRWKRLLRRTKQRLAKIVGRRSQASISVARYPREPCSATIGWDDVTFKRKTYHEIGSSEDLEEIIKGTASQPVRSSFMAVALCRSAVEALLARDRSVALRVYGTYATWHRLYGTERGAEGSPDGGAVALRYIAESPHVVRGSALELMRQDGGDYIRIRGGGGMWCKLANSPGATVLELAGEEIADGEVSAEGRRSIKLYDTHQSLVSIGNREIATLHANLIQPVLATSRKNSTGAICNHKMLQFLLTQMDKLEEVVRGLLGASLTAEEEQRCRESFADLKRCVDQGGKLIERHSRDFDLDKFYRFDDAKEGVEQICEEIQLSVSRLAAVGVRINTRVPSEAVREDERFFRTSLKFVLKRRSFSIDRQDSQKWAAVQDKWTLARDSNEERLKSVPCVHNDHVVVGEKIGVGRCVVFKGEVVPQVGTAMPEPSTANGATSLSDLPLVRSDEIFVGANIGGGVFRGEMSAQTVAVKKPRVQDDNDLEGYLECIKEICMHHSLVHDHIAKLLAVTSSGWMLMEWAPTDLQSLCQNRELDWCTKAKFLLGVACALEHMHSQSPAIIHCDVKSPNVLIFGDLEDLPSCVAKITDFGLSVHNNWTATQSIRRVGGTPPWMAPELYEDMLPSTASDVFGLGVIMYEVASQQPIYGGPRATQEYIMRQKLDGVPPCEIPEYCPPRLAELMESCCGRDYELRPTIHEVTACLRRIASQIAWYS